MKQHARHIAVGGVVAPVALGLATLIANAIQSALGLDLSGTGLALYIAAFCLGAAAVMHGQLRLEAQKIIGELGSGELDVGQMLGPILDLFDKPTAATQAKREEATDPEASVPTAVVPPPPPPPAP